jgi:AcrR family transcriptional regulator
MPKSSPVQRESTSAQRRILDAAVRLFGERGTTEVSVSELAEAAGVARGTIYNNIKSPETLFSEVAASLGEEMNRRVAATIADVEDPAMKLALGIRYYVRRAHEEPHWGRFIIRFGLNEDALQRLWQGPPTQDVVSGFAAGRYKFRQEQLPSVMSLIGGSVMGALFLVLQGRVTWRDAGSNCAELVLRALGIPSRQARAMATVDLPPLPKLP